MITSTVVHGDGVGKQSGYPTANLNLRKADVRLSAGVYAAYATLSRVRYQAALVVHDNPWKVEVFFFNFTGPDFYGQRIEVEPIQMVSQIERHDSMEELVAKIHSDLDLIKNCFIEHDL